MQHVNVVGQLCAALSLACANCWGPAVLAHIYMVVTAAAANSSANTADAITDVSRKGTQCIPESCLCVPIAGSCMLALALHNAMSQYVSGWHAEAPILMIVAPRAVLLQALRAAPLQGTMADGSPQVDENFIGAGSPAQGFEPKRAHFLAHLSWHALHTRSCRHSVPSMLQGVDLQYAGNAHCHPA